MKPQKLKAGDVVQLNPEAIGNKAFAGCMMIVTEPKEWGAQGYVQGLGVDRESPGGQYYCRASWDEMDYVGPAMWLFANE